MSMDEHDRFYREEKWPWMNDEQWECAGFLRDLFRGFHHVIGTVKPATARGIQFLAHHPHMATFDYNNLTRAVIMAHDRCIRFEVAAGTPGKLRLLLHKRSGRQGQMHERHPTMTQALYAFYEAAREASPAASDARDDVRAAMDIGSMDPVRALRTAREALFICAPSHQGGHSETGRAIADALGIDFPVRMEALQEAAIAEGFNPKKLWPWRKDMSYGGEVRDDA